MAPPRKRQRRNVVPTSSAESDPPEVENDDGEEEDDYVPPKRQSSRPRRSVIDLLSSSPASTRTVQSEIPSAPTTPTKLKPKSKTANHPPNAAPIYLPNRRQSRRSGSKSASTSPEKTKGKSKVADKVKSGNIYTFFSTQVQRQQAQNNGASSGMNRSSSRATPKVEERDAVEDGISDVDEVAEPLKQPGSIIGAAAKKRARSAGKGEVDVVSSSQKFLRQPSLKKDITNEEDMRPWAERFAPSSLDELAVHKKKVSDVRGWLESVIQGRSRQRVLVLKGAAGTGKTTTVQLLAQALGRDILEWRNPNGTVASSEGFVSMAAQFEEFVGRGGKFGQLDVFSEEMGTSSKPDPKPLDRRKSIIVVEEFPNTFTRYSSALQGFRSSILHFLAANTPSLSMMYDQNPVKEDITPIVMIISETLLTTTSASADSFTAHRLLGPEILQHPGVTVIEFNAIAPTLLAKALDLVVVKESRKSGRRKKPSPLVLKRLGEIGDVRSAINSLEFLLVRGDEDGDWGAKVTFGKGKRGARDDVGLTKMEEESLELITRREASLGIFHAVGKVVHNKRDGPPTFAPGEIDPEELPAYLSQYSRPKRSEVHVDELIDETGTDTQTFIAALHENYILSCDAVTSSEFSDIDHVNGCIDALSDSDLLCPRWDRSFTTGGLGGFNNGANFAGVGGDMLRQDELSFQTAVRGVLFSLPYPVKRRAPAASGFRTGRAGDAFKMFYPTSVKLWRMREEVESMVDMWTARVMRGDFVHPQDEKGITAGAAAFVKSKPLPGSVESWRSNFSGSLSHDHQSHVKKGAKVENSGPDNSAPPLLAAGASARREMLLERLPYMVKVAKAKRGENPALPSMNPTIRDMEKVTKFTGIGGPVTEDDDDDADAGDADDGRAMGENWATDRPVEGDSPQKKGGSRRAESSGGGGGIVRGGRKESFEMRFATQPVEQKWVLSDDDIEDD